MTAAVRSSAALEPHLPQVAIHLCQKPGNFEKVKAVVLQNPDCRELYVADCGLTAISLAEIAKLRKLQVLDFSGNTLDVFEAIDADVRNEKSSPIEPLAACQELEVLRLRKTVHDEEFSVDHLDVLTKLPRLRELDLSEGAFDFHVAGKFDRFHATLAKMPALKHLILQGNQQDFTPARLDILRAIKNLTVLT